MCSSYPSVSLKEKYFERINGWGSLATHYCLYKYPLSQRASQVAKPTLDIDSSALSLGPKVCPRPYSSPSNGEPSISRRTGCQTEAAGPSPFSTLQPARAPAPLLAQHPSSAVYTWKNGDLDTIRVIVSYYVKSISSSPQPQYSGILVTLQPSNSAWPCF